MKNISVLSIIIFLFACKEDKVLLAVFSMIVDNLHAPTTSAEDEPPAGKYVKFSFSKQDTISGDDWDLAFRGTDILINGGFKSGSEEPERTGIGAAHIATGSYQGTKEAPDESLFQQDSQSDTAIPRGSEKGWYIYDPFKNLISPMGNKVLIIKTHDGKYAKMIIYSYYEIIDEISTNKSQYYSFMYHYQPNEGLRTFE